MAIYYRKHYRVIYQNNYFQIYETYSWLWLDDKQAFLNYFLQFSRYLNPDERQMLEEHPEYIPENIKPKEPDLTDFKREIDYFMNLYEKCDHIPNEHVICRWLRLDLKPFKQTLLNIICKWANILKEYLVKWITTQ